MATFTQKQVEEMVAKAVAQALASAPTAKAKEYQAGIVLEGEEVKCPKGHIAIIMPLLASPKALKNGKDAYIAESRGSALHKATGEGMDFNCYIIKRG